MQAAAEAGMPPCPVCGETQVKRLVSSVALHLGGGTMPSEEGEATPGPSKEVFGEKELKRALKDRGY